MKKEISTPAELANFLEPAHSEILKKMEDLYQVLTNLRYEGKASYGTNLKRIEEFLSFLKGKLLPHIVVEDEIMYPYLEKHIPKLEAVLHFLIAEHKEFRVGMEVFEFLFRELLATKVESKQTKLIDQLRERGTYLIYFIRNHIQVENESVYRLIDQQLHPSEKQDLLKRMKHTHSSQL